MESEPVAQALVAPRKAADIPSSDLTFSVICSLDILRLFESSGILADPELLADSSTMGFNKVNSMEIKGMEEWSV